MSETENRLPITKERLARFEAYSNEDGFRSLLDEVPEGASDFVIALIDLINASNAAFNGFINIFNDLGALDEPIADTSTKSRRRICSRESILFLNLDTDLPDEEKKEFTINPSKARTTSDTGFTGFLWTRRNAGAQKKEAVFDADKVTETFPDDMDERFDAIVEMLKPKKEDLYFYCLISALDGVYGKNKKRFIAKILRKLEADADEKEKIDAFINELCMHERNLSELENSTDSYVEVKAKIKQALADEIQSVRNLRQALTALFSQEEKYDATDDDDIDDDDTDDE